jgi:hypothetical protein
MFRSIAVSGSPATENAKSSRFTAVTPGFGVSGSSTVAVEKVVGA